MANSIKNPSSDRGGTASDDQAVDEALERLLGAFDSKVPCAPVRDILGRTDIDMAYRVQQRLVAHQSSGTNPRIGRKIGLTSPAVQEQLGVDQPDFGTLLSDMRVPAGGTVASGRLLQPRIEAEIAFILGDDITAADPDLASVAAAVASAHASLEIVDSRVAGWDITIADTVADNASSGLFVVADPPHALTAFDPVAVSMELTADGEVVSHGTGAACLGNPLVALQWLASTSARLGSPLRAGEVVLSGALGPMVRVVPGSTYEATFTELGSVSVSFAGEEKPA